MDIECNGVSSKRLKKLIKVLQNVNRDVPVDKIGEWTKHIADEVYRSIPDSDSGDIDVVVTLTFDGDKIPKGLKKMIMDHLEEEMLR